jgi:hypothetical protein
MKEFSKPKVTIDLDEYEYLLKNQFDINNQVKTEIVKSQQFGKPHELIVKSNKGTTVVAYILDQHIVEFGENGNFKIIILKK